MRRMLIFLGFVILLCAMFFLYLFKDNVVHYQGDIRGARIVAYPAFTPDLEKLTIGGYEICGQLFLRYDRNYHLDVFGTNYLILLGKDGEVFDILIGISGILFLSFLVFVLAVMAFVDWSCRKRGDEDNSEDDKEINSLKCSFVDLIKSPSRYNSGTNLIVSGGRVVYVKTLSDEYKAALVTEVDNQKDLSEINRDEVLILCLFADDDLKEGDLLTEVVGELRQEEDFGLKTRFIDVEEFSIKERNPQQILDPLIDDFCRVMELEQ